MSKLMNSKEDKKKEVKKMASIARNKTVSVMDSAKKAVHNPVQNTAESSRIELHKNRTPLVVTPYECETNHQKAMACNTMQNAGKWAILDSNQ